MLFECDALALFFGFLSCVGGSFRSSLGFGLCIFGCLFSIFLCLLSGGFLTGGEYLCRLSVVDDALSHLFIGVYLSSDVSLCFTLSLHIL